MVLEADRDETIPPPRLGVGESDRPRLAWNEEIAGLNPAAQTISYVRDFPTDVDFAELLAVEQEIRDRIYRAINIPTYYLADKPTGDPIRPRDKWWRTEIDPGFSSSL